MEQKRSFPMKHLASVLLILLAGTKMYNALSIFRSVISNWVGGWLGSYDKTLYFLQNIASCTALLLTFLGFLLIGIALLGDKPRKLALCGTALPVLATLVYFLVNWMEVIVSLFRYGFDGLVDSVFNASFLLNQSYLLLMLLAYAAVAVVLLMHKKAPKLFCLVPSVLFLALPFFGMFADIVIYLLEDWTYDGWFVNIVLYGGVLMGVLEAVAFAAMLLAVTAKEKKVAEPEVIVETAAQEEIPAAEEVPAE